MSERYTISVNDRDYKVELKEALSEDSYKVSVDGVEYEVVATRDEQEKASPALRSPAKRRRMGGSGGGALNAPMPGSVVRLHVKVGDEVAEGDAVLTLESMKMESDLYAPQAGAIKAIHTEAGAKVAAGDPLLEVG